MTLEKTLRWIVLAGIFALPFIVFIVANQLFFPFITGKNFAFRIIVEIITGTWLALALVNPEYRPRKTWLLYAFAWFAIIILVADLSGVNPVKSIWSNYERMDGWVTLAHLFAYFVVASSVLSTEKLWRRLWLTSLGVSVLVGLYGLLQLIGVSTFGQGGAGGLGARLDATFGNPIYLAVFMLFNIFIAAFLWVESWEKRGVGKRLAISLGYGSVVVLDTFVLCFTGTRGTILGLIGGTLLSAFLIAVAGRNSGRARRYAVGTLVAILVLGAGFWLVRGQPWIHKVGFLGRLATISTSDNTVKARFMNWGMAWEGVKERPILGWGQENYAIVFDKYYNPQMHEQEQWFDRVHDIVFDWLVAGGFLGLFSYLMLFVCALWCIWRKSMDGSAYSGNVHNVVKDQKSAGAFSLIEQSILTGLLAGYFFHNLFVFDNISSYVLFASILAYIASRSGEAQDSPKLFQSVRLPLIGLPIVAVIMLVLTWGVAWGVNGKALAQNRALLQAIAPHKEGITKNLSYFQEAVGYGSFGTQETREQLVQVSSQIAGNKDIPSDVKKQFFDIAAKEMLAQSKASPLDARFPLFLGILLDAYGDYANAAIALKNAHDLSLKKQTILFELGSNAQARGDGAAALGFFKEAYELAPEFTSARIYYAALAISLKEDKLADELITPILKSRSSTDSRIASAYVDRGRYDKIVSIWKARTEAFPDDAQARYTLAVALYMTGNTIEAIAQLQDLGRVSPDSKAQADSLIAEIRNQPARVGTQ
ncbi:MAG: tetratricopeptide repeat protein [bacterium]|nr:tetratricopeptide repeat protein [bacterium]